MASNNDPFTLTRKLRAENDDLKATVDSLKSGGGGGTSGGMEDRVTRLETHVEYLRRDSDEIRGSLRDIDQKLNLLPTKRDLEGWRWQWIGFAVAAAALIAAVITGSLGFITFLVERQ